MNDQTPGMGHNAPPAVAPEIIAKVKQSTTDILAKVDQVVLPIRDKAQAEEVGDLINGLRKVFKEVDGLRAEAKRPHDEAAKQVQKSFVVFLDALEKGGNKLKEAASRFLREEQARIDAENRVRAEAARKAQEEAFAAQQMAAARGDTMALAEAEQQAADAERLAVEAARAPERAKIESATGGGRTIAARMIRSAKITSLRALFVHFEKDPEVVEALQRRANQAVRAKDYQPGSIPGIEIVETPSAA